MTDETVMKIPPELKAKWLQALRSGKYKQGQNALRTADNCFCCIGVLADIVDSSRWSARADSDIGDEDDGHCYGYLRQAKPSTAMLPDEMLRECGLSKDIAGRLAEMNDGNGEWEGDAKDFHDIADYIEENL